MDFMPEGETNYVPEGETNYVPGGETNYVPEGETNYVPGGETNYMPEGETNNVQSSLEAFGAPTGDAIPLSAYNPGNIIGYIEVDQLPEEYKGLTPTVKVLPIKIVKKDLPPENKSNNLPPKDEYKKLKPLFPPGTEAFAIPNF